MAKLLFLITFVIILFSACTGQPQSTQPSWVINPNQSGKSGAIGIAGRTYDQKISTQRKLAITRALDELSMQQQVKVQMSLTKKESITNNSSSMSMDFQSNYATNSSITAHIEGTYIDKISGEIYIWMLLD